MIRDYWEFLSKDVRARVIFGVVLGLVMLVVAIPYFVTVLNNREAGVEIAEPVEVSEVEETKEVETEEVAEIEEDVSEVADENTGESEATYAYYAPARGSTTTQSTERSVDVVAAEKVTRTTVDDRSAGDDGYTASGVDDLGASDEIGTDGGEVENAGTESGEN